MACMNDFSSELRNAIGSMTMRQVSAALDIPYRTIQDWMAGRRTPTKFQQQAVLSRIGEMRKDFKEETMI